MDSEQRLRIVNRHRDALQRHGHHPHALYWSSKAIQELRFQVLLNIGISNGDSVLDVGCGFGDLADYLKRQGLTIDYTGIDLSPDLIEAGQQTYTGIRLLEGDLFEFNPPAQSYDYVLLSGALNEAFNDEGEYARSIIERMFKTCRKGVAFNLLNRENDWVASRPDLQSFFPEEMRQYCRALSDKVQLRSDYLDNDLTIYLLR